MTTRTPSMVSEVSAMEVASTTLRRPGFAGLDGEILLAALERAVERREVDGGIGDALAQKRLDPADLALPRQEDQDGAGLGPQGARDRIRDLLLDAAVGIAAEIAGLDRIGAAFGFDRRAHRRAASRPARRRGSPT